MESLHEAHFILSTLSLLSLLFISIFTYIIAKKMSFPYTVLLVLVGLLLVPVSQTQIFSYIDDFKLTPNILFYVFLPILLFESAYNINYKQLLRNKASILSLAVVWLLISASLIAGILYFLFPLFGLHIPFLVCLLFWGLISATDPVAVLSIFKTIGAPRRLALIFEGESIFNDGTALAFFLVVLGIILEGNISWMWIFSGIGSFFSMMFGGVIFGIFMGILFSKILEHIKNNESVEIGLTIIMAHLTFILSELIGEYIFIGDFHFQVSGVIATAIAGITIWNYGRYKISPKVEESIERFWIFFAFVANSLVFILLGLILSDLKVNFSDFILPIFVVIFVVMAARAASVYLPLWLVNRLGVEENIPLTWQHLLSWGSLRGALAIMMVYLIPAQGQEGYEALMAFQESVGWDYSFSIRDFIMVITIGSIMFTLFIKATTISFFMKRMGVDTLHEIEEFEYQEGKILMNLKVLEKLSAIEEKGYINKQEHNELRQKYEKDLAWAVASIKNLEKQDAENAKNVITSALTFHALGIEKQYLKDLYFYHEVDEYNFKIIFNKITRQIDRMELGLPQLREEHEIQPELNIFERIMQYAHRNRASFVDTYMRNRTRVVITRKVIKELTELKKIDFWFDPKLFDDIIDLYQMFHDTAKEKKEKIRKEHSISILSLEAKLADKSLLKVEEKVLDDLYEKEIITPKIYLKFQEEIEHEILKDFRQIG
jgi:CPA1 family monovalent cation:H+ antiporter